MRPKLPESFTGLPHEVIKLLIKIQMRPHSAGHDRPPLRQRIGSELSMTEIRLMLSHRVLNSNADPIPHRLHLSPKDAIQIGLDPENWVFREPPPPKKKGDVIKPDMDKVAAAVTKMGTTITPRLRKAEPTMTAPKTVVTRAYTGRRVNFNHPNFLNGCFE